MQDSLVSQGANLMLFGMGSVFVFLTLLVVVTYCVSTVVQKLFPEPVVARKGDHTLPRQPATVDPKILPVIRAAIAEHRSKRRH